MKTFKWYAKHITTMDGLQKMVELFQTTRVHYAAFDTETTGLHIIKDKPFLYQFGWTCADKTGYAFAVDLEEHPFVAQKTILAWHELVRNVPVYAGHNVKFDLHMLQNINFPYRGDNLTDTQFYIRYAHDALHQPEGGPPLGLKNYCTRYIEPEAKFHEQRLKEERTAIAKRLNEDLKQRMGFTLAKMKVYFNDCIFTPEDLPDNLGEIYMKWKEELPYGLSTKVTTVVESDMIPYNILDRKEVIKYALMDIVWTLEVLEQCAPVVRARKNMKAVKIENKLILPFMDMERVGFQIDTDYLNTAKDKLREYILKQRQIMKDLTTFDDLAHRHNTIKHLFREEYDINLKSTDKESLERLRAETHNDKLKQIIDLILKLRTLEKWYSTYVMKFWNLHTDRIYTTINQVQPVTGRISSDFQQFPRGGIKDDEGNEIFNPRQMIKTPTATVYLDYSQIELRFQAIYTILCGHPDVNMCRAYMPLHCHRLNFERFDYNNPEHIKQAYDGSWFQDEDNKPWKPVDVHGATTTAATGLQPWQKGFKEARYDIGKRVNFAKNYGATRNKIRQMFPDKTEEEITRIDQAYYKAFPGIKTYHGYCNIRANTYPGTGNMFGVIYYGMSAHKLKNALIQGSAAYFLKLKIIELYEYCQKHGIKSPLQMQIHDELSWIWNPEDDPEVFFKFKEIMEDWKDTPVPIVADMEATTTTWAEKKEINTVEELKELLYAGKENQTQTEQSGND